MGEKHLVIVVHGIGDSKPGETARALARGIAAVGCRSLNTVEEVRWLEEGSEEEGRQVESFPCHTARLTCPPAKGETILAEAYWADLSTLHAGIFSVLLGLVKLVFGLRHLAWHAADPRRGGGVADDWATKALRGLSAFIAHFLRAPVLAALLLWGFGWALSLVLMALLDPSTDQVPWAVGGATATGLVGIGVGVLGLRHGGSRTRGLFSWLALSGLMVATLIPYLHYSGSIENLGFGLMFAFTNALAGIPGLVVLFTMPVAAGAWFVARLRSPSRYRPGLDLAQVVNFLTGLVLTLVLQTLIINVWDQFESEHEQAQAYVNSFMLPSVAFYWILALLLGVIAVVTFRERGRWAQRHTARSYDPERPPRRILLGDGIRNFCILMSLVPLTGVILPLWEWIFEFLARGGPIIGAAMVLIGTLVLSSHEFLHLGLDLALDIVTHFRRERVGDGFGYPQRDRIRNRLRLVLQHLIAEVRPDRLTIVAHSQGTVVSVDLLAEIEARALLNDAPKIDLVTMGSPFHHFYQRYFPNDYPPLSSPKWKGLRERVGRWVNIFRIDDPVGADIEPGESWPENVPVDAAGHTNYWTDRQVLEVLTGKGIV